jgi:hypothetical protein
MALSSALVRDGRTTHRLVLLDVIVIGTHRNPIAAANVGGPRHFTGRNGTIQGGNRNCLHLQRHYVTYSYIRVYHCGREVSAPGSYSDPWPETGYLD